jgi:hypothetical protein
MNKRYKYVLKTNRSKGDVDVNSYVRVELTDDRRELPVGAINHVLNVGEQFNKERQEATTYRLIFTITPLFSNVLYNMRGRQDLGMFGDSNMSEDNNGLETLNDPIFLENPYDGDFTGEIEFNFKESLDYHLREIDGWFGFFDPDLTKSVLCKYYDLEPSRKRFDLNSNLKKNWEITMSYPNSSDDTHVTVNGGLLITEAEIVTVGSVPMIALGTSVRHGLNNGDKVRLSGMPDINYNGDFTVNKLGLTNGDQKDNYFVINLDPTTVPTGNLFTNGRMKRLVNGVESIYYLRKFKKLVLNENNYEIYPLAFSKNIFKDFNYQLAFNEDIDTYGLTDNLGRPLSEMYLTMHKIGNDEMFTEVKSGLDLDFLPGNLSDDVSNIRRIHDGPVGDVNYFTSQTPLENDITSSFSEFYGDVVEYNKLELKEHKLADVLHRVNTNDRESIHDGLAEGPRREGYLYKPHHLVKIKEFSLYIEQGDENTGNLPDYAEDLGDGRFIWRDLLDVGVYDGEGDFLDYPFTNGNHYIHTHLCFGTNRQDPFGVYDLYYSGIASEDNFSPKDPIGDGISDKFITKNNDDAC